MDLLQALPMARASNKRNGREEAQEPQKWNPLLRFLRLLAANPLVLMHPNACFPKGQAQSNRCRQSRCHKNPCKYSKINGLQSSHHQSQSRSVKLGQTCFLC